MAATNDDCTTWETFDTTLTADCVEFCPSKSFSNVLVSACYQLEEGNREGRIYLQSVVKKGEGEKEEEKTYGLKQEETHNVSGVFDLKWDYHRKGDQLLASVHADGGLRLLKLGEKGEKGEGEGEGKGYGLEEVECGKIGDGLGGMGLSVDWSGRVEGRGGEGKRLVVSYSDGSIACWSVCIYFYFYFYLFIYLFIFICYCCCCCCLSF